MTRLMRWRWTVTGIALGVTLGACGFSIGVSDGPDDGSEMAVGTWDLRESNDIEAIGWPEELTMSATEVRAEEGLERILLPGGVELTGFDRANPARWGGVADLPLSDDLRSLLVAYVERSVDDVGQLATAVAKQMDLDSSSVGAWVARNREQPDLAPAGASELLAGAQLGPGVQADVELLAASDGEATLFVSVTWEREEG